MHDRGNPSRRSFLRSARRYVFFGAAAAAMPRRARAIVGPGDVVRLGQIGTGGMGSRHLEALAVNPNCRIVAICDVAKSRMHDAAAVHEKLTGRAPELHDDFRALLDRNDIDAVFSVTPDHWHPLTAILACQAGKDVYVEKPVSPTVAEGRAMAIAARRYGRVMQVGTQQRSMPVFQRAIELVHSGRLGQITAASAWVGVNGWGIGETPAPEPRGFDWNMWLGPAPYVPYAPDRLFGWMGWHDYARGGQLTNWGIHLMDIVQWGIRQDRPLRVHATGGSYRGGAGADNYETIEATLEYPGCTVTWEQRHQNTHGGKGYGIAFYGAEGALFVDRGSFVIQSDKFAEPEWVGEPEKSWANPDHHNNFFHCVRTRQRPAADIEQAHRSTTAVLLAGISLKARRPLEWDGEAERFVNDPEADRFLTRAYRAPWHL